MYIIPAATSTMYFICRVALFFANNCLTERWITMVGTFTYFLDPEVLFSLHTIFINASTKKFTLVNNAIPSYHIAFKHLLYILQDCCQCLLKC